MQWRGSHVLGDAANVAESAHSKGDAQRYLPGLQLEALTAVFQQLPPIAPCRPPHDSISHCHVKREPMLQRLSQQPVLECGRYKAELVQPQATYGKMKVEQHC